MTKRRIFIGDIQGCREELERLLEAVHFHPTTDELHPVGDLVNRGPDSEGVLRLMKSLEAGGVLGNHDVHLLRTARGTRELGKRDTLDGVLSSAARDELLAWLAERPIVRVWPDLVLVHAAIHPAWKDPERFTSGLAPHEPHPALDFATRTRYCAADGDRPKSDWPPPSAPFRPWFEHWEEREHEERTVVFGHWARLGLVHRARVRGLDSGCVWGGALTAWIPEEDRFEQVQAKRAYCPVGT